MSKDMAQVVEAIMDQNRVLKLQLTEAMDLLSNAGPNPLCINETEYFERLEKLQGETEC